MKYRNPLALTSLVAAVALGLTACGPSEEGSTEAPAEEKTSLEQALDQAKQAGEEAKAKMSEAAEAAGVAAGAAMEEAKVKAAEVTDVAKAKMGEASEAGAQMAGEAMEKGKELSAAAAAKGAELMQVTSENAEAMIQKVKDSLANNDIDLAKSVMDGLAAIKDSLPENLQAEIEKLQGMFGGAGEEAATAVDAAPAAAPAAE